MVQVRLQKILSEAGVASRRGGEELIRAGKVSVNGQVISQLGFKADPASDRIRVNGKPIPRPAPKVYYLLYKPRGVITSLKDPEGRPTITLPAAAVRGLQPTGQDSMSKNMTAPVGTAAVSVEYAA